MNKSTLRLPTGSWFVILGLFVFIIAFNSGSEAITNQTITKEITVSQSDILFTNQQRIDFFVSELLTPKSASCFKAVVAFESHFNVFAKNAKSTASGVGQLLTSTYKNLGLKKSKDAIAQTVAALAYISERYGSAGPCGAWHHELKFGWY